MCTHGSKKTAPENDKSRNFGKITGNYHPVEYLGKDNQFRAAAYDQLNEKGDTKESHADKGCDLYLNLLESREKH
jgi:hypothetical protein